ncbi:MAG TPA: SRPBCC family protein [bacterium]|nr:SRPBCC family protein [bacterium]
MQNDCQIVSQRVFKFPRERMWRAFSDPGQLARWWGPKGFTNTFYEFDLRPGGVWRFLMQGPNGAKYPNESRFVEVVEPERIVYDHVQPAFRMTITLADQAGKTELTWRMLFSSASECAKFKNFVPEKNEENFDRLEAHLTGK